MPQEIKKSRCENHLKWGPKISEMMRGFQTGPQNSNRIKFDPLLAKNIKNRDIFKNPMTFSGEKCQNLLNEQFLGKNGKKSFWYPSDGQHKKTCQFLDFPN